MKSVKRVVFYFIYSVQLFVFVGDLVVEVFGDCLSDSFLAGGQRTRDGGGQS